MTDIFYSVAEESIAMLRKRDGEEMADTTLAVCSATRSAPEGDPMQVGEDLDNTQVSDPGGMRWKRDYVAKEMLASCAEDAASKATKEMESLMMKDADEREQRLVERDRRIVEHLGTGDLHFS